MTPIDAQTPISVTLVAEQWNGVLQVMGESPMPYRMTAPLIQSIGQQLQEAAERQPKANGQAEVPTRHIAA